ncbi:hypothetical protein FHS55_002621 [Angulomicrobium tetraedrale]|uniref:Uncharacterized protein n=1 Tax=Ancylobacter tetraedralis TaxID=217068 RepID=A0A839ZBD7_9HYPH|nr:hypothetical protein [Ancylobacter tetraedralis]MBB3772012.1 hypothetical protein [Ancylobacter tetraedralis]
MGYDQVVWDATSQHQIVMPIRMTDKLKFSLGNIDFIYDGGRGVQTYISGLIIEIVKDVEFKTHVDVYGGHIFAEGSNYAWIGNGVLPLTLRARDGAPLGRISIPWAASGKGGNGAMVPHGQWLINDDPKGYLDVGLELISDIYLGETRVQFRFNDSSHS